MTECPERTVAAWIWLVPPLATPIFALLGIERVLRRFILDPETFDQAVYDKHVENRLAHEGLEDERKMRSLDHPEGITPTVRKPPKPADYYLRRVIRACKILPRKKRHLARVIMAIYYHGRNIKRICRVLGMTPQGYIKARNWLYVYFVILGNWERI